MLLDWRNMLQPDLITIDSIHLPEIPTSTTLDILRLDKIHPVVSGNKWFKLKYYLGEAQTKEKTALLTFGGAYSNHISAVAFAAKYVGLTSIGFIRGERPAALSSTLIAAEQNGMQLHFLSREAYNNKSNTSWLQSLSIEFPDALIIPEGGSGIEGERGSRDILSVTDSLSYSHIVCAVGTGTMFTGIVDGAGSHQQVIGIPVVKGMMHLPEGQRRFIMADKKKAEPLWLTGYDFGGYAKKTPALIGFMNTFFERTGIPTDFVYTGKLLFGVMDLMKKGYFPSNAKVLVIHSGGLQGNSSLTVGTLVF